MVRRRRSSQIHTPQEQAREFTILSQSLARLGPIMYRIGNYEVDYGRIARKWLTIHK